MIEFTLFDKISTVFNLIFSTPLFLILILGFILMIIDINFISKKDKKTKIIYFVVSIVILGLLLEQYFPSLLNIFNIVFKNIVSMIYFPTVLEYIIVLLISLFILLFSIFNKNINRKIKIINEFVFSINTFIFFLILDQISSSKVNLASKLSIYTNDNLMMLFELSIAIFVIWVIGLILYKIIHNIIHKDTPKDNFYEEPELPKTIEEMRKQELIPKSNIEYVVVEKKNDNDMFTLEEYKEMRALLEVIKNNKKKV